jgi:Ran GTPase-activating protein (RanGAP) involved in mRNA processing and transport
LLAHSECSQESWRKDFDPRCSTSNSIYLEKCHELKIVPEPIVHNPKNESLDLHNYGIGDKLASALCDAIGPPGSIRFVDVRDNRLSNKGMTGLLISLKGSDLVRMDLSCNTFGLSACRALADCITDNSHLMDLSLENTAIGDRAAVGFAEALVSSTPLMRRLNLSKCGIAQDGAEALGALIAHTVRCPE